MTRNRLLVRLTLICGAVLCGVLALMNAHVLLLHVFNDPRGYVVPLAAGITLLAGFTWLVRCMRSTPPPSGVCKSGLLDYTVLFVASFALRLFFVLWIQTPQYSDFQLFHWVTSQIARREPIYLGDPYFQVWAYQIGFPALMFPVLRAWNDIRALLIVNCVFMAGSGLCILYLLRKYLPRATALLLASLYCLLPYPYALASVYTNQHLAMLLFYAGMCFLAARDAGRGTADGQRPLLRGYVLCGIAAVLVALGNMARPEGVLFVTAGAVYLVIAGGSQTPGGFAATPFPKGVFRAVSQAAVFVLAYFLSSALLSGMIVWTGTNPHGLQNEAPLYKFAVGLNAQSGGRFNAADAAIITGSYTPDERDAMFRELIRERLSRPVELPSLFVRKSYIVWTEYDAHFPAILRTEENHRFPLLGYGISARMLTRLFTAWGSLWFVALYALAALVFWNHQKKPQVPGFLVFIALLLLAAFAAFLLVEVQRRYAYVVFPALFAAAAMMPRPAMEVLHDHPGH